jgi:hypothetical protein
MAMPSGPLAAVPPPARHRYDGSVPRLFFETAPPDAAEAAFGGPTDVLVHFLSFAFASRYGAQHEFSKLALLLRAEHKLDLRPLLTFADRNVEEDADARELERVWQDAAPLAETLRALIERLDAHDPRVDELVRDAPDLRDRLADLLRMADEAAERGARVRLTFEL